MERCSRSKAVPIVTRKPEGERDSSLQPLGEGGHAHSLPPELPKDEFMLFLLTQPVMICYGNLKKLKYRMEMRVACCQEKFFHQLARVPIHLASKVLTALSLDSLFKDAWLVNGFGR